MALDELTRQLADTNVNVDLAYTTFGGGKIVIATDDMESARAAPVGAGPCRGGFCPARACQGGPLTRPPARLAGSDAVAGIWRPGRGATRPPGEAAITQPRCAVPPAGWPALGTGPRGATGAAPGAWASLSPAPSWPSCADAR